MNTENYIKHLSFSFIIALIPSIMNLSNSIYANTLTSINIIPTALFLIAWSVYGFYNGSNNTSQKIYAKYNEFFS